MKKLFFSVLVFLAGYQFTYAQDMPFKVVFDVTSPDTMVHHMVMRWVNGIAESDPEAQVEVVFYAGALDMVLEGKSVVQNAILSLKDNKNVQFNVCEMSLKRLHLDKNQLVQGVNTVPDAIYEIVSRQHDGWGYIKASR